MDAFTGPQWERCSALLKSITDEWDKAEQDIKLAEQISNKVVFPSIKELRYAGRRLIEVIKLVGCGGDVAEIETKFRDIQYDCHRARHDAIDAGTAKIAADVEIMAKKLGYGPILKIYPEFGQLHRDLNQIRVQIAVSRGNTNNRDFIYAEIENGAFPKIVASFRHLQSGEAAIKGLAKSERREKLLVSTLLVVELIALFSWVYDRIHENWSVLRQFL